MPRTERLRRAFRRMATVGYPGTVASVTAVVLAIPFWSAAASGVIDLPLLAMATLALIPASDVGVALTNRLVTHLVGPRPLPRLELVGGVPSELRTLVVVPTLLADEADIEAQVNLLEVQYLANAEGDLRFALLTDWLDAPKEHVPDDEALLAAAVASIDRLNARHGEAPGGGARFLLFHRERRWNAAQGVWMGWERKRGKLHELNALLNGSADTSILVTGRPSSEPPSGVRYVITLDSDTRLPRGAAARLVGTMAHPLNRPVFDAHAGRVVEGHAILQPRVTATLPAEQEASIFQRVYSGSAGIDPYASAVSDVYQDLFGEGSYTGKGIYDLAVFEQALADRAPENTLLSHDLLEGTFARAGLVTDIELLRRVTVAVSGVGGTAAPVGPGRLAAPALDPGPAAWRDGPSEPHSRHRALEDGRQPAPNALRAGGAGDASDGLDAAFGVSRAVDRAHRGLDARASLVARAGGTAAAAARDLEAQSPAGRGHGPGPSRRPRDARHHVPRPSGRADDGRHPEDPPAGLPHSPRPARMEDRSPR